MSKQDAQVVDAEWTNEDKRPIPEVVSTSFNTLVIAGIIGMIATEPQAIVMPYDRDPLGTPLPIPAKHPARKNGCGRASCRTLDRCLCECKTCKGACR